VDGPNPDGAHLQPGAQALAWVKSDPEVAMPLPLAPLVPFALRLGALAAAALAVRRAVRAATLPGRTDQRAEDAMDDLGEGVALHRPPDRGDADVSQTNTTARWRRTLHWGKRGIEIDAALLGRFRIRKF